MKSGVKLILGEVIHARALPAADSYYVVSDQDFEELPAPSREEHYHAWQERKHISPFQKVSSSTSSSFAALALICVESVKITSLFLI
ncbi:hypothetical protein [Neobacillus cucumis]|uniref:hypothetical protein n=1 Tax=Neobacillus cucumis TaxID=1740721 RepID=UPI002E23B846|nr:hypothetical protein [Neobacillus cucumis]